MRTKTITYVPALLMLACLIFTVQRTFDNRSISDGGLANDLKYLPNGKFLQGAALSYDEVLADFLWIKAIGYFGEHYSSNKKYQWLPHILDVVTTLDPSYSDPYEFAGIVLSNEANDVDASIRLLKKGMENVPQHHERYWYLPFFTAYNYMYFKGDYQTAARYLEIASSFPASPKYLPLLVSRLYANTDDPAVAIPFLEKMIERAGTPEMEKKLEQRIKEIWVRKHLLLITTAKDRFKETKGRFPRTINELVVHGFVKEIPQEPFGGSYYINKDDHSIHATSEADDMELHIDGARGQITMEAAE